MSELKIFCSVTNGLTKAKFRASPTNKCNRFLDCFRKSGFTALVSQGLPAPTVRHVNLMFIGPCIIAIVDEWKTNFMSLAILFYVLCAQHVSDINKSIFRSLRLCWWITALVVLFSVRCVLELSLWAVFGGVRFAGWSLQNDRCGNLSTQSQAPEDGFINVRNMLST